MKISKLKSILLFAGLLCLTSTTLGASDIKIHDLKLYVNCEEFIIKGMCYNPVPLGWKNISSDQTGGAGYCSIKRTPFGEWKSACFDSDFFDGSADIPDRYPAGPAVGWFQALWERDFPVMKELGVNTLRLYNTNPVTRQASIEQKGTNGIVEALGKNHIPFMDMAAEYGFKVIFPLMGDQTILTTRTETEVKQFLKNQIDEVGNHSALLMWNFSNELPLAADASLVELLNKYMVYIKEYTMQKWNRFIPVTVAVVDLPDSYDSLMANLDVDIFSSNAGYRGLTFQDLWIGNNRDFSGFANLTKDYNKPLFIAEIGWHQVNNEYTNIQPDWFNQVYKDLVDNMDYGTIGGAFFEYSDEPYSKVDVDQQTMGVVAFNVSSDNSGKTSMDQNMFTPDIIYKKPIFDTLKSGTFAGKAYNFNTDVWELMGRERTTLSSTECTAAPTTSGGSTSSNGSTSGNNNGSTTGSNNNGSTGSGEEEENSAVTSVVSVALIAFACFALAF